MNLLDLSVRIQKQIILPSNLKIVKPYSIYFLRSIERPKLLLKNADLLKNNNDPYQTRESRAAGIRTETTTLFNIWGQALQKRVILNKRNYAYLKIVFF